MRQTGTRGVISWSLAVGFLFVSLWLARAARAAAEGPSSRKKAALAWAAPFAYAALGALAAAFTFAAATGAAPKVGQLLPLLASCVAVSGALVIVPARGRWLGAGLMTTLFGAWAFADALHYRHFALLLPWSAWHGWEAAEGLLGYLVTPEGGGVHALLLIAAEGLGVALFGVCRLRVSPLLATRRDRVLAFDVLAACIVLAGVNATRVAAGMTRGPHHIEVPPLDQGLWGARLSTGIVSWERWRRREDQRDADLAVIGAEDLKTPAPPAEPSDGSRPRRNLVLIQVESLNAWVLDRVVGDQAVTPRLNRLAREGLLFTGVMDQTGGGRTSDAEYLVMASQHSLGDEAVSLLFPFQTPPTLAQALRTGGWSLLSVAGDERVVWNGGVRRARYGFERALFAEDLPRAPELRWHVADSVLMSRASDELPKLPEPFFLWVITQSMHGPHWEVPVDLGPVPGNPLRGTALGNYLDAAHHTDTAIGALLDSISEHGHPENTFVVVYGDHTESYEFQAEDYRRVGIDPEGAADRLLLRQIPLIVVGPGVEPGTRVDAPAGLIDLGPTLLGLLGEPAPRAFLGRDLLGESSPAEERFVAGPAGVWGETQLLEHGSCLARAGLEAAPASACDSLVARARRQTELSHAMTRQGRFLR